MGFTILSISISLIAVFTPLMFMGGVVGLLMREFAVTLSAAVLVSMVLDADAHADAVRPVPQAPQPPSHRITQALERGFKWLDEQLRARAGRWSCTTACRR